MSHGGGVGGRAKVTPNLAMDEEGTRMLNLTVLQRLDPAVEDILITAAHVTLYDFDSSQNQWSRKDVEGSLFVVKRNTPPRFQFIVMNRRNTDNLVEDLLGDFEYQLEAPYIMYRNAAHKVFGIWFYNSQECEQVANLFSRILSAFSKVPPKNPPIKSEFEELEATPVLVEGPLEPPTSNATATAPHVQENLLSAFFSAAANVGGTGTSGVVIAGQQNQSFVPLTSHVPTTITTSQPPAFHHLLPSQVTSASRIPSDVHSGTNDLVRSTSLVNPSHFSPLKSSQESKVHSSSAVPTALLQHPRIVQQPQSAHLLQQPFPLPAASHSPPYGTPLLQPFPPPNPSPSLASASSVYSPLLSRDKIRDALLRLVENDDFIDLFYREIVKG